jgi:hypothetical protein
LPLKFPSSSAETVRTETLERWAPGKIAGRRNYLVQGLASWSAAGSPSLYLPSGVLRRPMTLIFLDSSFLQSNVGHTVGLGDYARLAWMATSVATVAGDLIGAGRRADGTRGHLQLPAALPQ